MGYRNSSDYPLRHIQEESSCTKRNDVCKLCGNKVSLESSAFYCRTCSCHYHKVCLTVTYPKIYEHTLTFIHRNNAFTCDACGLLNEKDVNMFVCLLCDFFVHRKCIFLPKVIKLTRHPHFLSHTLCIPHQYLQCRVCRNSYLKSGYGGYICNEKTCDYVTHSFCATSNKVWDGRDFEGEPKEKSKSEVDLAASVEIDGISILHFSHEHDLTRFDVNGEEECGQVCQACILPIEFGNFLGCKQCDFAIHEACASLPRKLEHVLHRHPLTLQTDIMNNEEGFFTCSACNRESCGFMYKCCQEECGFKIDVKCASFVEPFNHSLHAHPLFLTQHGRICDGCYRYSTTVATCTTCYVVYLEFKCVTLPRLVKYKHDVHPLTLYCDQRYLDQSLLWWCEVCEEEIHVVTFFYVCHECITTLHVKCLIGKYPYLKHGHRIKVDGLELEIASNNNGVSRSICHTCHRICKDKLVFINGKDVCRFCSIECIRSSTKVVENLISSK